MGVNNLAEYSLEPCFYEIIVSYGAAVKQNHLSLSRLKKHIYWSMHNKLTDVSFPWTQQCKVSVMHVIQSYAQLACSIATPLAKRKKTCRML